jgi:hypothetical protein
VTSGAQDLAGFGKQSDFAGFGRHVAEGKRLTAKLKPGTSVSSTCIHPASSSGTSAGLVFIVH